MTVNYLYSLISSQLIFAEKKGGDSKKTEQQYYGGDQVTWIPTTNFFLQEGTT